MTLPAISVRGLGKMYRLAHESKRTDSFREAITSTVLAPFRRLRQLRGTDDSMEEFWALKDVSFDVQPGEVVGIIGRNGAGKSTLLKILSRIVEPTAGEIRLRGRVASLLEVGTGFHPELTGRENIYLNGSILGMKKREIDRKFDEIVDFAEVEKFLDTPVKRYSSGMYVRLAFAVAAHLDPEILIVDEVLAVGDAEFQKKCLGKMKQVSEGTGRTVLFVSHNMAAVSSLCTTCVILNGGETTFIGDVNDGIRDYLTSTPSLLSESLDKQITGKDFDLLDVNICGPNGNAVAMTHKPCCINVHFRSKTDCLVAVYFAIEASNGSLVTGIDSLDLVENFRARADNIVCCKVSFEEFPLIPGSYRLQLMIRNDSDFRNWTIPGTIEINVEGTSVYGQRQVEPRWHGTTAIKAKVCFSNDSLDCGRI